MEIWKDIKGYEGLYQVSNLGRVKSLKFGKERILKAGKSYGYLQVCLSKSNKQKPFRVHTLVAIAFLNYKPVSSKDRTRETLIVDHINRNKADNHLSNLRLITHRENMCNRSGMTSGYAGVYWNKRNNKWQSQITINGNNIYLGQYKCELAAAKAYQDKLAEAKNSNYISK